VPRLPRTPTLRRLCGLSRRAALLILGLVLAAAVCPPETDPRLWEARTVVAAARELLRQGDGELARLVLDVGAERLSPDGRDRKIECRRAPSATGRFLVAARRDILLAYALTQAGRPTQALPLLRAALDPLDRYARFGARDSRATAAALEGELRSELPTGPDAQPPSAGRIAGWWSRVEELCHGTREPA